MTQKELRPWLWCIMRTGNYGLEVSHQNDVTVSSIPSLLFVFCCVQSFSI